MDLRDYYTRKTNKNRSRSDRATSWRQKRTLSSNLEGENENLVAFQEPILKKGKPTTNAFQSNTFENNTPQINAFRNSAFHDNVSQTRLLSASPTMYNDCNNNAHAEQAWKRFKPLDRHNSPPGLPSPLMLPAPMSLPSDMYPNEVPTKSYPLLSGHSFFGYSPFAPPSNVPLFFQQQQSSVIVPDCKILQTKDNNQQQQQQAHQLFSQHPYLKGLHQHSNNRPATTIKSEPMDTEISSKPSWSKVVAGERPTANSFPVLSNSSSAYQATDDEAVEDMMSCDLNSAISKELRPIVLSPSKPGCSNAKYLTDSISYIASSMEDSTSNENCSIARPYTVVKITNIPWSVDSEAIKDALMRHPQITIPDESVLPHCMHVIMDVKTGKTLGTAYAEVNISGIDKRRVLASVTFLPVQGRRIHFAESSYDDLCNEVFADWNGEFRNGKAIASSTGSSTTVLNERNPQLFIGQKELQCLLNVCRLYKVHYNRKCPERPFEYLITLIMCIPWKQPRAVTTIQRDIIYECYKLVTESLRSHTNKTLQSFNANILPRLVRSAILCHGFTVKQKIGILTNSQLECPPDLKSYLQEPLILSDPNYSTFMS